MSEQPKQEGFIRFRTEEERLEFLGQRTLQSIRERFSIPTQDETKMAAHVRVNTIMHNAAEMVWETIWEAVGDSAPIAEHFFFTKMEEAMFWASNAIARGKSRKKK